ncbi:putative bifunctional diguanylate cyclase/phosphodiesterase [Edaphobacter aggregans]|uniref:putative bifunctional diguanylate cyclase/phosphodiesterase n=1 Tax=Edaphobacter aggregans TaxID=570835 RepID=UPI00068F9124|nr:bifunctional diguanylate cyclase/phosphodiesterase [Edaphobacter aggregans]
MFDDLCALERVPGLFRLIPGSNYAMSRFTRRAVPPPAGHLSVMEDVTVKHHRGQDNQQALYDDLTGLPNRRLLAQQMVRALTSARESGHRAAILCLAIDRFQQGDDGHGQIAKDKCMKRIATMLTRRLRGMDLVVRTGEEEFTIVLGEIESVGAAGIVAKALVELFAIPLEVEQCPILLRASVGGAVYPDHGEREMQLWQGADTAMRRAKRDGGGRYHLAAQDTSTDVAENVELEDHIRTTLQEGGLRLHYQLQYHMNGQIRGVEALLRLPHPTLGYVSPDRFIPLAEASGLIHPLGKFVIKEACRQLMLWNKAGMTPVRIAINVSPLQLMRSEFAAEVQQAILESDVDPALLEIEITERVILNFDETAKRMTELAALGIRFAVDDFGTGYASLQHLHRLPISTLKIDRSFIQRLCESSRSYPIVKAIVELAHSLKMQVIAEGVEDEDQLQLLRELKCDCIQGFLLSRPLPPEEIKVFLSNQI